MADKYLTLDPESQSIQTHLGIIQSVIQRMASNSANCKTWCVTLVAAVLVIVADKGKPEYAWIAFLPTFILCMLDSYYLSLEKAFRNSYQDFISKVHSEKLTESDLYSVAPMGNTTDLQIEALKSFAVWGFYGGLACLIVVTKHIALT